VFELVLLAIWPEWFGSLSCAVGTSVVADARMRFSAVVLCTVHQREAALIQISVITGGKTQTICASQIPWPISPVTLDYPVRCILKQKVLEISMQPVVCSLTSNPFPLSTSLKAIASSSSQPLFRWHSNEYRSATEAGCLRNCGLFPPAPSTTRIK